MELLGHKRVQQLRAQYQGVVQSDPKTVEAIRNIMEKISKSQNSQEKITQSHLESELVLEGQTVMKFEP
jgi:hypothetical protein